MNAIPEATGFGLFLVTGIALGVILFVSGIPPQHRISRIHALVAAGQATGFAFLGAWVFASLERGAWDAPSLSLRGALLGAGLGAWQYAVRYGLNLSLLMDAAAGPLLLAEVVCRFGCVLAGCSHGNCLLYAGLALLSLTAFAGARQAHPRVSPFALYLVLSAAARLAVSLPAVLVSKSMAPCCDLGFAAAGVVLLWRHQVAPVIAEDAG